MVTAGHAAIQVFEESAEDAADLDDASANELGDNDFDLDGDVEAEDDVARDRREAKERARARKRADLRDDDTEEEHRKARSGKRRKVRVSTSLLLGRTSNRVYTSSLLQLWMTTFSS